MISYRASICSVCPSNSVKTVSPAFRTHPPYTGSNQMPLVPNAMSGQALTRESFVAKVREMLSSSGIDRSKYAGSSFRISTATTAAQCGIADSTIQLLGRWRAQLTCIYYSTQDFSIGMHDISIRRYYRDIIHNDNHHR